VTVPPAVPPPPGPPPFEPAPAGASPQGSSSQSFGDAEVTPVTPEEIQIQGSEAAALAVGTTPEPSVKAYDPAPAREAMRNFISYAVLITTAVTAVAVVVNAALGGENPQIVMGVFTALVGLSGTILGFYFGGKDNTG
jgi:hypothetical protein